MVQISTNFFAYKPILRVLQQMDMVPMAESLGIGHPSSQFPVGSRASTISDGCEGTILSFDRASARYKIRFDNGTENLLSPECLSSAVLPYLAGVDFQRFLPSTLDSSQRQAIHMAFRTRASLTQGPPGTGKTFIGESIAEIIHNSTTEVILCLCYTNHALDQFLEALLDKGATDMVRIGGRSKSPRLQQHNIREKVAQAGAAAKPASFNGWVAILKCEEESLRGRVDRLSHELRQTQLHLGNQWVRVKRWLQSGSKEHRVAFEELKVNAQTDDGFAHVGPDGKALKDDHKWLLWVKASKHRWQAR